MAIPWNEDDPRDAAAITQNLAYVLRQISLDSHRRRPPTVSMAQDWHRRIYKGVSLPVPYYAGEVRDSDARFPELYGYEVKVGRQRGVDSRLVPLQLAELESAMERAVAVCEAAYRSDDRERGGTVVTRRRKALRNLENLRSIKAPLLLIQGGNDGVELCQIEELYELVGGRHQLGSGSRSGSA